VQIARKGHLEPEACCAYILSYLGDEHGHITNVTSDDLTAMCNTLQGRPRFTASFVSKCLEQGARRGVMEIFNEFVSFQVTGTPLPQGVARDLRSKISIYWALDGLHARLGALARRRDEPEPGQGDVMWEFLSMALRFAITGTPQLLTNEKYLELIENGIANIDFQQGSAVVLIREPIVVRAASYFFGLLAFEKSWMAGHVGNLSALGNEFEAYVALALFNKRPLSLSKAAAINLDRVEIPEAFVGEWGLWYPEEAVQTGVLGCDSKQDDDLVEFLGCSPHRAFLFPSVYAGSDVFNRLYNVEQPERHLRGSLQMKFREEVTDPERAIATTDLQAMFTRSDGTNIKTRKEVQERALKAAEEAALPSLRVLVAYPAVLQEHPPVQVVSENEIVLIIDGRNADAAFQQEDLALLRQLYERSRNRGRKNDQPQRKRAASAPSEPAPTRRSVRARRSPERLDL
jgi:hypothetical protein